MIDHVDIGHEPIISVSPIIASPDLSGAGRYAVWHTVSVEPIGEKVRAARKDRGMTQGDLGKALGVVQSVVSDIENGKLKSWPLHRVAIQRALGKPRSYFEPEDEVASDEVPEIDASGDMPSVVQIPEYDVRLSAGGGFVVDRESTRRHWPLPRFLIVDRLNIPPGRATVQEVIGDSMEPTLSTGDYVLIDMSDQRLGLPGIFALWDGDALVCKRLERVPGSDPSMVRLKSDNALHGEYQVPEDRVRVIGRVRWVTRRM